MSKSYLSPSEHFNLLLEDLSTEDQELFNSCRHVRQVTAFAGRTFVVYKMEDGQPVVLDHIVLQDFHCDNAEGATTLAYSQEHDTTIEIGYLPVKLFQHPVQIFLPLHCLARWSVREDDHKATSLTFPLAVRTMSRIHLRERNVVYFEAGPDFNREFEKQPQE